MSILVNLDGGELTLSKIGNARIEQIPIMISIAADIFSSLLKENIKPDDREFSYCIQINPEDKEVVAIMLARLNLPDGIDIYKCDGRSLFEIRGSSGGIVTSMCFYIITKGGHHT